MRTVHLASLFVYLAVSAASQIMFTIRPVCFSPGIFPNLCKNIRRRIPRTASVNGIRSGYVRIPVPAQLHRSVRFRTGQRFDAYSGSAVRPGWRYTSDFMYRVPDGRWYLQHPDSDFGRLHGSSGSGKDLLRQMGKMVPAFSRTPVSAWSYLHRRCSDDGTPVRFNLYGSIKYSDLKLPRQGQLLFV